MVAMGRAVYGTPQTKSQLLLQPFQSCEATSSYYINMYEDR